MFKKAECTSHADLIFIVCTDHPVQDVVSLDQKCLLETSKI